jgi:cation diffusion facilitator CzcD-associated flavoprotein CzcO
MVSVDLLVVGAGPHALTLLAYLAEAGYPLDDRVMVADRAGWLEHWDRRLGALGIPMLRSSCVHHPDPDPMALLRATADESLFHDDIGRPDTALFHSFCEDLLTRLGVRELTVRHAVRDLHGGPAGVRATLGDGTTVQARRVVLATNPARPDLPACIGPGWARLLADAAQRPTTTHSGAVIAHSDALDLDRDTPRGGSVIVVGGGLTAAQLALGALDRGAEVTMIHRSPIRVRELDAEPTWMNQDLVRFLAETRPRGRAAMLKAARTRGTLPPRELADLRHAQAEGRLEVMHAQAVGTRVGNAAVQVQTSLGSRSAHALWLATGHRFAPRTSPLVGRCLRQARTPTTRGLGHLTPDLRLPGTAIHMMGAMSALQTGPLARSLVGARIAAERIAPAISGLPLSRAPQYPPGRAMTTTAHRSG